ncbi:MAG: hypothetical protein LBK83_13105 [Treponema sp.]|nr:hypothetical protein [Treponema sp.]
MNWLGRVFLFGFILSCTNIFAQVLDSEDRDWSYFVTTDDANPDIKIMGDSDRASRAALTNNKIPANTRAHKYIEYGNGCFVIAVESDRVYKFSDEPFMPWSDEFIVVLYYDFGEQKWYNNVGSYFNVRGMLIKFVIEIKSDNVLEEKRDDSTYYTFISEGIASFVVTIGDAIQQVDIQVVSLPIKRNVSIDTIIETIGFPDKDIFDGVDWPRNEYRYGFSLAPEPGRSIYKHFYFFRKYPYLVLSAVNNKIDDISYMWISN